MFEINLSAAKDPELLQYVAILIAKEIGYAMRSNIDVENEIIYDRLNINNKIEYGEGKVDIIRIFDEKGNTASISDIQKNMLLSVYKSENYIEIHICAEAI